MQHRVTNGRDATCNMNLPRVGYMQHRVTNGRDPICNMKLPMAGTLYVTRDPKYNGTLPTLQKNFPSLAEQLVGVIIIIIKKCLPFC